MKNIVRNVITSGAYNLPELLRKIDTLWAQGSLTDTDKSELVGLAQAGAKPEHSVDVLSAIAALELRVKALEEKATTGGDSDAGEEQAAPDYVVGKWYYTDDLVTFKGKVYKCIAPAGVACVWSPADYPVHWEQISD